MTTARAVRIENYGGPEVMQFVDSELPEPGQGEACIRHTAIGLNFIDIYHRTGLYPLELPSGLGTEAAGVVEAIGPGVSDINVGDRVVYSGRPLGAYADRRNVDAGQLVNIPDAVSDDEAAAGFLKGMTAWFLLHRSYAVQAGDPILVYAAAGGVGSILSQWGRYLDARVIGIVSSEQKAEIASAAGCEHVIMAAAENIPATVRELTDGQGVAAVYDSVGRDTFMQSLDCLRPHGVMVTFGNASGAVEPFAPAELAKRHSLYVTRPTLFDFVDTRERLLEASATFFAMLAGGHIKLDIGQRFPLKDVARAHEALASRATTGSSVLIP